jgi:hypothetical protein
MCQARHEESPRFSGPKAAIRGESGNKLPPTGKILPALPPP